MAERVSGRAGVEAFDDSATAPVEVLADYAPAIVEVVAEHPPAAGDAPDHRPALAPPLLARTPAVRALSHDILVVWRVVDLEPSAAAGALAGWLAQRQRGRLDVGRRRFVLEEPARWSALASGCRVRARFRRRWSPRVVRLDLDLVPWSDGRTEIDLRPRGVAARALYASCSGRIVPTRWANGYFSAAHAVADELRTALPDALRATQFRAA